MLEYMSGPFGASCPTRKRQVRTGNGERYMMVSDHGVTRFNTHASTQTLLTPFLAVLFTAFLLLFAPAQYALADAQGTDVASGTSGTCSWVIDANGKLTVAPLEGDSGILDEPACDTTDVFLYFFPWYDYREHVKSAEFKSAVTAKSCRGLFRDCAQLSTVDLTGLDTSNATSMRDMFRGCEQLASVDLSNRNFSNLTSTEMAFSDCKALTHASFSDVRTPKLTSTAGMFRGCSSLASIDLSSFDTSNVTRTSQMFEGCTLLESVALPQTPMSALEAAAYMFRDCESLTSVDLSSFATARPIEIQDMFDTCRSLETLDLSPLDMSRAKCARYMLYRCNNLKTVYVSSTWSISTCDALGMLYGCTSLVGANGTAYDPEHTDGDYARVDTEETPGYFWLADGQQGTGGDTDDPDNPDDPNTPDTPGTPDNPVDPDDPDPSSTTGGGNSPVPAKPAATGTSSGVSKATSAASKRAKSAGAKAKSTSRKSLKKAKVKLSKTTLPYTGKAQKPKVTVKLGGKKLKAKRDYMLVYSKGRKNVGTYKVTIKGKGAYKGKLAKTFKIVPKASAVKKLKAQKNSDGSNGFIVTWKKVRGKTGYELRWSTSKKLKGSEKVRFAASSPFAKKTTAPLLVRTKAWHGKKLYVQVRAFQKVKGKTYRSAWSKAKAVKLKK